MYNPVEIGKRIKEIRKEKKLSQTELAELLGKSLRTIQKYESGEIEISIATINDIAEKLNTSPTYFVGYDGSRVDIENLADIFKFLFQLEKKADIRFELDIHKPKTHGEWKCSISFNGNDHNAEHNADICLFLERYAEDRDMLETYWITQEKYQNYQDKEIAYYARVALHDREAEELDDETRRKRRDALMVEEWEKSKKQGK